MILLFYTHVIDSVDTDFESHVRYMIVKVTISLILVHQYHFQKPNHVRDEENPAYLGRQYFYFFS